MFSAFAYLLQTIISREEQRAAKLSVKTNMFGAVHQNHHNVKIFYNCEASYRSAEKEMDCL